MNHSTKLINELRDALVEVTDRLAAYRDYAELVKEYTRDTNRIIAAARVAIDKATTT